MPFLDPAWLIFLGVGLMPPTYAIRDELRLRTLFTVSTFVYIAYD